MNDAEYLTLARLVGDYERQVAVLTELVDDFTDPEDCHLDHDGDCQAHNWFGDRPCPHARAKALLEGPSDG